MGLNMNERSLDALLKIAGKKLGTPPDELRKQIQSGKLDNALGSMSKQDSQKLSQALSNPVLAERILSTPQAQAIFKKLSE